MMKIKLHTTHICIYHEDNIDKLTGENKIPKEWGPRSYFSQFIGSFYP